MLAYIDFETRSPVPISHGVYNYAEHADIICMAWAIENGPVQLWLPLAGEPFPEPLKHADVVVAHNAEFEAAIVEDLVPELYRVKWVCTASWAAAAGLPRNLDGACKALHLKQQKQADGNALIKKFCVPPYADAPWTEDPEAFGRFLAYCVQDVEAMRELHHHLEQLVDYPRRDFDVNLMINHRGIPVDRDLARHAVAYADQERTAVKEQLFDLTGLDKTGRKLAFWVHARLSVDGQELMGEKVSLDAHVRQALMEHPETPPEVKTVLELMGLVSKSSVSKYQTILDRASTDGRVRGCYLLNGAASTGRYSSQGLQMHNLPRTTPKDPEAIKTTLLAGAPLAEPMKTLSQMLRPTVCSPKGLTWGDWSAIEGRVLPWLANTEPAGAKLDLYRQGQDVYVHTAQSMGLNDRQIGKVAELSLGYAGGPGALANMGRNYGVSFTEDEAQGIKHAWREANRWAVDFWDQLDTAFYRAATNDGEFQVGRLSYSRRELDGRVFVACRLPSGRELIYPDVLAEDGQFGIVFTALKGNQRPKAGAREWPRHRLWKGLLAENVTQAVAADILRDCLVQCQDLPVIGHTHDEIIVEGPAPELQARMETAPAWAEGLPLKAEVQSAQRYGK